MLGVASDGPTGPVSVMQDSNRTSDRSIRVAAREASEAPVAATTAPVLDQDEREAWALLASVPGIGPVTLATVVELLGSARAVLDASLRDGGRALIAAATTSGNPRAASLVTPEISAAIVARAGDPGPVLDALGHLDVRIVLLDDPDYPSRLLSIEMPPPVLFLRGDPETLSSPQAVAIVGTRAPTETGRALAMRLASLISAQGATIISGLAIGIDGAAHVAAVNLGRPTVAVLGGGHDRLYPRAHRGLAQAIIREGGAVVSEMAPLEDPTRWSFVRRNRLISGLADAVVVIEAPSRSGAINTGCWALEQGRGCFVVPGRPGDRATAGALELLREHPGQARVVSTPVGLLEDLGLAGAPKASRRPGRRPSRLEDLDLSSVERRIAELVRTSGRTVDEISDALRLPVATILSALTTLEMRGLVVAAYGRYRPTATLAGAAPLETRR